MDEGKILLCAKIAFLPSVMAVLLGDALLQTFGIIIAGISGLILVGELVQKLKEIKEEKKSQKEMAPAQDPNNPRYYLPQKGVYLNDGSAYTRKVEIDNIDFEKILKLIKSCEDLRTKKNFLVRIKTRSLIGAVKEREIRLFASEIKAYVNIGKDISSLDVPDGVFDASVIVLKLPLEKIKELLNLFEESNIDCMHICDDYNSRVFSQIDTNIAINNNYTFKIILIRIRQSVELSLSIKYGKVSYIEEYTDLLLSVFKKDVLIVEKNASGKFVEYGDFEFRLMDVLIKNSGLLQKDLKKYFPEEHLHKLIAKKIKLWEEQGRITRIKSGNSYRVFWNNYR